MIAAGFTLAVAAAITLAALLVRHAPHLLHAVHALTPYAVAGLWVLVLAADRSARRRDYHRRGRPGVTHHRQPPLPHRAVRALVRLSHLRLTITPARTTS